MLGVPHKDTMFKAEGKPGDGGKEEETLEGVKVWDGQGPDFHGWVFQGESEFPYRDGP